MNLLPLWKMILKHVVLSSMETFFHNGTVDANGSPVGMMRYTAFCETRLANGATNTDYRYTGQREEAELGLYFYNARWYDPSLGRFIQPDSLIPNPGNPMDWDRYAYVRNNPINNTDPTGNKSCDGKNSGGDVCNQITSDDWATVIRWSYGWTITDELTNRDIDKILEAGAVWDNAFGQGWTKRNIGNASYNKNNFTTIIAAIINASAFVFPKSDINLRLGESYDVSDIVHELVHVLDNNNQKNRSGLYPATIVGGGPSDTMIIDLEGDPYACMPRLQCWSFPGIKRGYEWYRKNVAGTDPWN